MTRVQSHLIVEELRNVVESGRSQVIVTTHSPYFLDLLPLWSIVLVERTEDKGPVFTRPGDNPNSRKVGRKGYSRQIVRYAGTPSWRRVMKVGLIVEGLPDRDVLSYLAKRISSGIHIKSRALGKKPQLIKHCGEAAKLLLDTGCCRVVIVWDLYPAKWGKPFRIQTKSEVKGETDLQARLRNDT